eukprot:TRINITY_DN2422_c0_g1_i1.p1 TRINITY_DN2422_c0_g1~~TRINITY_DN2422_c0_g1_i1.p1  ORF type:complete len:206 (-),score=99.24 TRINITY_DN2422_c0_g1_i1:6-623(-)
MCIRDRYQRRVRDQTAYAFIPDRNALRVRSSERPLPRAQTKSEEDIYHVPDVQKLRNAHSNPAIMRRRPRVSVAEPESTRGMDEYGALGEQRFEKFFDESEARAVSAARQSVSPRLSPRVASLSTETERVVVDGVVELDSAGQATVHVPSAFVHTSDSYRYQLTCIGRFAPIFVAQEIDKDACTFAIGGGSVGAKVSWQVAAEKL